ncbi:hypothetical protein [Arthrobacter sp. ISL-69]|uniref:hypothetical protein n=1 Tax=Arthrobacter sp. ISL-69 TaxID=2819113 RepID=UPI001BEC8665|nr:hypothetical protein [Arthrobacter sp. ISL-69]MBT2539053.1 hypothetical protein [Arthrobacter sp. ISL-69]
MSKVYKGLITLLVVAVLTSVAGWLLGPGAAGTTFLVLCIIIGGYLGTGWGGRQATKTHEYREEWLHGTKRTKGVQDTNKDLGEDGPTQ